MTDPALRAAEPFPDEPFPGHAHPTGVPSQPPVVLIVEDEQAIAESVAMIVEDAGYATIWAANGRQALSLAHAHAPALIITDLMMPIMTGEEFIAALRHEYPARGRTLPPIVLMTAASMSYARGLRADAVLSKPFDISTLEDILAHYL